MPYFVFAEFGDDDVLAFLRKLRDALSGSPVDKPIHVTLRGAERSPDVDQLNELSRLLPGYGVRISGHGYFATPSGFAVFLRAECVVFRQMWDKPDFRVPLARIEPHITVFETTDRDAAQRARAFLRSEELVIHTYKVHLSIYESRAKQRDFFELPTAVPTVREFAQDVWRVPDGYLERAHALGVSLMGVPRS